MLAKINDDGDIVITPCDSTERYALKKIADEWDNGACALILEYQKGVKNFPKKKN